MASIAVFSSRGSSRASCEERNLVLILVSPPSCSDSSTNDNRAAFLQHFHQFRSPDWPGEGREEENVLCALPSTQLFLLNSFKFHLPLSFILFLPLSGRDPRDNILKWVLQHDHFFNHGWIKRFII